MAGNWFKPKAYGYGASPANWKGWAATLVFTGLVLLSMWLNGFFEYPLSLKTVLANMFNIAVLAAFFVVVSWLKTDGEWRWRSGEAESKTGTGSSHD